MTDVCHDAAGDYHMSDVRGVQLAWTKDGSGPLTVWAHGLTNSGWALEHAGMVDRL